MQWIAILKNGKTVFENLGAKWEDIKNDVVQMGWILTDSNKLMLPENTEYFQPMNSASSDLIGNVKIESRYIPFKIGSNVVKARIHKNGQISIET